MKVKLATQILSHTLASAIFMAVSGCLLPPSAVGTAELIDIRLPKQFIIPNTKDLQSSRIISVSPHQIHDRYVFLGWENHS